MNYYIITGFFLLSCSILSATEFTISTYNCGGLTAHYDYLRAAHMQKLMQERYNAEPENMALNEKIQRLALKILFEPESPEKLLAQQEWEQKNCQQLFERLTAAPSEPDSPNRIWNEKSEEMITTYKIRPVSIYDEEVNLLLNDHMKDLSRNDEAETAQLLDVRATMAKRIFTHHLKYDIICLQEADYLDPSMFPEQYRVQLAETSHSKNGIAWNRNRFELIETIGNIRDRAFAIQLQDKESGKKVLVASGHISGCNPYRIEKDPATGVSDSAKGDQEIQTIIKIFDAYESDLMLIGMDSNVTSLHPRLKIVKNAGYKIDYENNWEATCTNPHQVLNTRIDWIALKADTTGEATITNIPVAAVQLNSIQTNISDHKPVAAKISY